MNAEELASNFTVEGLQQLMRGRAGAYRASKSLPPPSKLGLLGELPFGEHSKVIVAAQQLDKTLTSRTGRKKQYEEARKLLKDKDADGGLFAFYNEQGNFRFSFVRTLYSGTKRKFSTFKRYSFFVIPNSPNKTFIQQFRSARFDSIEGIQKTFSLEAVTEVFYKEFEKEFEKLAADVRGLKDSAKKQDFALLFVIRIIFLGFVQKKKWLGGNLNFLADFLKEYEGHKSQDTFYKEWLEPLFLQALKSPPGQKVNYQNNPFSEKTDRALQMAPFLNGGLFTKYPGLDDRQASLGDDRIREFMDFLFQYNFTIEENTNIDEDLELNPEFLGIIFERLVNKSDGAVYTPRTEVDFMCRMALVKWLQKATRCGAALCDDKDLFELFFREGGTDAKYDDDQKDGNFSPRQIRALLEKLRQVTICDPAAGSGAFEVGMLQVLNEVIENLRQRHNTPKELKETPPNDDERQKLSLERKKEIIAHSLYGVEVRHWAVWINQLRLWLSLFIDMSPEDKDSRVPLLPSLDFKVREGDSLIQRLGGKLFPIRGHATLTGSLKGQVTKLRQRKVDFYNHTGGVNKDDVRGAEAALFRDILEEEIKQKTLDLKQISEPSPLLPLRERQPPEDSAPKKTEPMKQELEKEIKTLQEELAAITKNRPLIWNIEFADIFYDKEGKGGFDIIIGNPPYIRQEAIADPANKQEPKLYKERLKEVLTQEYPTHFNKARKIDGKSDLYTYFYAHSLKLLNPEGYHCFICSNSWLDVGFGAWLQELLLEHTQIDYIVDNHCKRSFASADVNTIITFIHAPNKARSAVAAEALVKFVAFKRPFEEVILTENLLEIEEAKETLINDGYRAFALSHADLKQAGSEQAEGALVENAKYIGDKWGGKYLRAPDIFFTIMEKGEDKLVPLKQVAEIKFGIKTGCNEFFYLTAAQAKEWNIEKQFLKPAILKTNEVKQISLENYNPNGYFFLCAEEKKNLKGTNALSYIENGEKTPITIKQGTNKGKTITGFHNIESVKNRNLWYSLGKPKVAPIMWIIAHNERHLAIHSNNYIFGDNFFCIFPKKMNATYLLSILNTTYMCLFRELYGRANYGGGLLKTQKPDLEKLLILSPDKCNIEPSLIKKLENRKAESIFTECGLDRTSDTPLEEQEPKPLPDRAALDKVVFDALNLTQQERKDVYRATCRLVHNRLSKAKNK